jgi:hypothetical protein
MSKPSTAETNAIITAHPLFELEDVVIKGVTHKCWKNNPTDYRSFLIPRLEKWADRPFMDAPIPEPGPKEIRQSITFGELLKHGYVLAAWLREQGVGVESKVGLAGFNSIK